MNLANKKIKNSPKLSTQNQFFRAKSVESDEQNSPKPVQNSIVSKSSIHRQSMVKNRKNKYALMSPKEQNKKWMVSFIIIVLCLLVGLFIFFKYKGVSFLINHLRNKQILVIFVGLNGNQQTYQSLSSFLDKNDYPIKKFVCIVKSIPDQKVYENNQNFIWIVQEEDKYFYNTLDKILDQYKMQYFFYFDDQWQFLEGGFIIHSLNLLEQFSSSQQILLYNQQNKLLQKSDNMKGFSFSPGLHRRSDFLSFQSKFSLISQQAYKKNSSVQQIISGKFIKKYMYALTTKKKFVQKITKNNTQIFNMIHQAN